MIHTDVLRFRGGRYLWWSLAVTGGAFALYFSHRGLRPPAGDTWQGYVLGTVAALLILWLTLLAIRKRRYSSTLGTVQGWTSAHVYLGTSVLVVATLHCAFQFGWNVHTLAYALMCLVIGSGFFGLARYVGTPKQLAENRQGASRAEMFGELLETDKKARAVAEGCSPPIQAAVSSSIERTTIGGGVWAQLLSRDHSRFLRFDETSGSTNLTKNADQHAVIAFVGDRIPRASKSEEAARLQQLLVLLCRRQVLVRRIRRDIRLQGWLKVWLYFHVRITAALLVALVVHIGTTFLYR